MDRCLVCNGERLEGLLYSYHRYNPRLFHSVAICRDCGHIQLYPLFSDYECQAINDRFFRQSYMVGGWQNEGNNRNKTQKLDRILGPRLAAGQKILDVGAGEAWAMEYFKSKGCMYFAVEAVDSLASHIQLAGGIVIGKTIFTEFPQYKNCFDVIVFRHIIEHLRYPRNALVRLKELLRSDGLIYVALPDAGNPSLHKGFRTSFIRPIHVSYFCKGNVIRLAAESGLKLVYCESGREIVCLFRSGSEEHTAFNYYSEQKKIFIARSRRALGRDIINTAKDLPRSIIERVFGAEFPFGKSPVHVDVDQ